MLFNDWMEGFSYRRGTMWGHAGMEVQELCVLPHRLRYNVLLSPWLQKREQANDLLLHCLLLLVCRLVSIDDVAYGILRTTVLTQWKQAGIMVYFVWYLWEHALTCLWLAWSDGERTAPAFYTKPKDDTRMVRMAFLPCTWWLISLRLDPRTAFCSVLHGVLFGFLIIIFFGLNTAARYGLHIYYNVGREVLSGGC